MSLVVLKDVGYQEYQNLLLKAAHLTKESEVSPQESSSKPRYSLRAAVRSAIYFASLSALLYVAFFMVGAYFGLFPNSAAAHRLPLAKHSPQNAYVAPALTKQIEETDKESGLWKCNKDTYTNAPNSAGTCQFLGEADEVSGPNGRFITPMRPSRS